MDKKIKKKLDKKCCFCGESDYALLDLHRIEFGQEYSQANTITCCCKCHRKIHAKELTILGKRFCTSGHYVIHFVENEEEKFKEI